MSTEKMDKNMDILERIREQFDKNKLELIINNINYIQELNLLTNKVVLEYYKYIIDNITLDKDNPNNSYIMWLCNKVEKININLPTKIIKGKVSLPDIDVDVPANKRDELIEYIKEKYGEDKVGQMITIIKLKGRSALKAVFRAHGVVSAKESDKICRFFPDEAKIADELQEMKEEDGESSIIRWTLENDEKGDLREYCYVDENDELAGPLAKYFEQAIRLEGTKTHQSRHPAGIIIANEPLSDLVPMVYDSSTKTQIVGFEMNAAENIGLTKFDLLGLSLMQKMMDIQEILKYGDIKGE